MICKMMHQIGYVFIEVLRNGQIWAKKRFGHFVSFLVSALLHLMSYPPRFCQMKDVIKIYISVGSFISTASVFAKLKVFLY